MSTAKDAQESLCRACALCCDGTLFRWVRLSADEATRLAQKEIPVGVRRDGTPKLLQRCGALSGCDCEVYAERPQSCRSYACLLSTALSQGECDLAEALEVVAKAQHLLSDLTGRLPSASSDEPTSVYQRAARTLQEGPTAPTLRAAFVAAEQFFRQHFLGRRG